MSEVEGPCRYEFSDITNSRRDRLKPKWCVLACCRTMGNRKGRSYPFWEGVLDDWSQAQHQIHALFSGGRQGTNKGGSQRLALFTQFWPSCCAPVCRLSYIVIIFTPARVNKASRLCYELGCNGAYGP